MCVCEATRQLLTATARPAPATPTHTHKLDTDVVNRLPFPLEYIFNTPMAHRMHHRPPGNCNYAGMFIIWDRMFGTYKPELQRKDYYGLAKQPNTFDPLKLNTNHFNRMADIDSGDGKHKSSILSNVFARRVPAKWVCNPMLLFEPIPPLQVDERSTKVLNGMHVGHPNSASRKVSQM